MSAPPSQYHQQLDQSYHPPEVYAGPLEQQVVLRLKGQRLTYGDGIRFGFGLAAGLLFFVITVMVIMLALGAAGLLSLGALTDQSQEQTLMQDGGQTTIRELGEG